MAFVFHYHTLHHSGSIEYNAPSSSPELIIVFSRARMAGRRLELIIVFSRAGGLALAVAAMLLLPSTTLFVNRLIWYTLFFGAIPFSVCLLWLQARWLCLGGEQPDNVELLILIVVESLVACFTVGTVSAAIAVDIYALQYYDDCAAGCMLYLVTDAMACAAGALAAVSALGMLWILGSRFRAP